MSLFDDWQEIDRRGQQYLSRDDGYVPWGTGLVEGAKDLAGRAVNQLQEWAEEDPDTWTDDALRLMGGGVKNVGNTMADWERRSEEGELGVRSAAGTALRFMNWSSEQGARLGRTGARAVGVNEELGGFLGSFLPEAIGTKGLSKAAQVGKTAKQMSKLRKLGYALEVEDAFTIGRKGSYALAFGGGDLKKSGLFEAFFAPKKTRELLGKSTKAAEKRLKEVSGQFSSIGAPNTLTGTGFGSKKVTRILDPDAFKGNRELKEQLTFLAQQGEWNTADEVAKMWINNPERYGTKGSASSFIRERLGMSPHHYGMDLDLSSYTLNTTDNSLVSKILREQFDVYPGDHINNFIGAFHDDTARVVKARKAQLAKQLPGDYKTNYKEVAKIDKKRKIAPTTIGSEVLEGIDDPAEIRKILSELPADATPSYPKGTKLSDLELPDVAIARDHQEFIHGITDKLPERQKLIELAKSDRWLKMSPESRAYEIAKVARLNQNVTLNVNRWRLNKIIKAMKADKKFKPLGKKIQWHDIQEWIVRDPRRSAMLEWHGTSVKGINISKAELVRDLSSKEAQLVADVFGLSKVPLTSNAVKKFEKANKLRKPTALENVREQLTKQFGEDAIYDPNQLEDLKISTPKQSKPVTIGRSRIPRSGSGRQYGYP